MISVIIPVYNHAALISKTLDSILAQSYQNFEIIVVDDGSGDDLDAAIQPYLSKIKYIKQKNSGAPAARNNGFRNSKGDCLMFADADLVMEVDCLKKLLQALIDNTDCSFSYPSFKWGFKVFSSFPYDEARLKKMNYIHTSALIKRQDFPGFDESIKKFQDWDLWLTMLENGKRGIYVPEVLYTIDTVKHEGKMSDWLPKFMYKIPWAKFGIKIRAVEKYEKAKKIISQKHNLGL